MEPDAQSLKEILVTTGTRLKAVVLCCWHDLAYWYKHRNEEPSAESRSEH